MDLVELEGYLVALIAWPVGIAAGAWLPRIWGIRGWKVPNKIATRARFDEFNGLVIGFLRHLDRELVDPRSRFKSSVLRNTKDNDPAARLHIWGRGFMTALTLGSQGFESRDANAGAAVRTIADATSASTKMGPNSVDKVVGAVMTLMEQRTSRGPLGALEIVATPALPR